MNQDYANLSKEALDIISDAERRISQTQSTKEKVALVAYRAEH